VICFFKTVFNTVIELMNVEEKVNQEGS